MAELDADYLQMILDQNRDKPFVARMYEDKPATLDIGGGQHATHKMAWGQVGNKFVAFPTVMEGEKGLQDYGRAALAHALDSNNYIEFTSPEQAEFFSKNYKSVLNNAVFR